MILIAVGVLVVLIGGGGAAFYFGALDDLLGLETAEQEEKRVAAELAAIEAPLPPVFHEFPVLVVDLKQISKKRRTPFLKIKVVAELAPKHEEHLKLIEVKILDGFQTHLRGQTRKDIAGKEGTDKLRLAFLDIVNSAMAPGRVDAVHFRQIILQ
jgi:flagellar basal body-associated protein FliL